MTDNTTAVAYVNKQGSTRSKPCNTIARDIWMFAIEREIWVTAAHCPGSENCDADEASRVFDDNTEWSLRQDLFEGICKILGQPEIDLFASRLNHKVDRYCAWQPDPGAIFIDSLMYDWSQENVYAFPPFSIIHMVIQKWIQDQAEGIIVVPKWPSQPWYTLLNKLIVQQPIMIEVITDELFLPFSKQGQQQRHPMAGKLTLMVARCSGRRWQDRGALQLSSAPSWIVDAKAQTNFTKPI